VDPRTAHRLFAFTHEHAFDDAGDADAVRALRDRAFPEGGASAGVEDARRAVRALAEAAGARPGVRAYVDATLAAFAAGEDGRGRLEALLSLQHWRLTFWRRAWRELNYRRFFDVSDLVALRAEDPAVFDATHRWALARVAEGRVHALRVDHVDGLRDPLAYLRRLRAALDARAPGGGHVPVFVEKILVGEERLRAGWPVDGTTGYEALNAVEGAFVHALGAQSLERFHRRLLGARGAEARFQEVAVRGKEYVLRRSFRPEIRRAVRALMTVARDTGRLDAETAGGVGAPLGAPALAEAVLELAATLPVYRTYVTPAGGEPGPRGADAPGPLAADAEDFALVDDALARALKRGAAEEDALRLAASVLVGDVPDPAAPASARVRRAAAEFALRFQQTSGPATAKGVEDTALYRWSPLASLCEVGGEPDRPLGAAVAHLHAANAERLARTPLALVTVNTHDVKRSADARARLDALAEVAGEWRGLVERWRRRHAPLRRPAGGAEGAAGRPAPDPAAESLLYQTLVAVWPAGGRFRTGAGDRDQADDAFTARVLGYAEKAAREAKQYTTWTSQQPAYEAALREFARALLQGDAGAEFRRELGDLVARVAAAGAWTSLARTAAYGAAPGTPDVYQGDELWQLALVDPDNRRRWTGPRARRR
jgi:(1->4)-alpha-D-glucan 1-alpha-D-glucosylmutase